MALTDKDLENIGKLFSQLWDSKFETLVGPRFQELFNRIASLEDDFVGLYNKVDTELPIISHHLKEHTDRLEAIEERQDSIDKFMISFDSRLNRVDLAVQ